MNSIDGIIENYLKYTENYKGILNNYINMYGKDVLYHILPENNNDLTGDNIYIKALGKHRVSFDYSSDLIKKLPAKLLIEYPDWYRSFTGEPVDMLIYFSDKVSERLNTGDVILHENNGKQLFYRVMEPVETYQEQVYRAQMKLIQSKEVKSNKNDTGLLF